MFQRFTRFAKFTEHQRMRDVVVFKYHVIPLYRANLKRHSNVKAYGLTKESALRRLEWRARKLTLGDVLNGIAVYLWPF